MNNQSTWRPLIQGDEIDLRELWKKLVKRKVMILLITMLTTIGAIIYVNIISTAPHYSGEVLIEIGDVIINPEATNDKPTIIQLLEDQNTLKEVLTHLLSYEPEGNQISIEIPKGSNSLLRLSCTDTDTIVIQSKIERVSTLILERHKKKTDFYQKTINATVNPTVIVAKTNITANAIHPNKAGIITSAFIVGLLVSIFFIFLIELIGPKRDSKEAELS